MCTLLRPDIVVASKVKENLMIAKTFFNEEEAEQNVYITVDSCLAHQKKCKEMGFENIFTGDANKEWDATDYESYIKRFPRYFVKESEKSPFYKVELAEMRVDVEGELDIAKALCSRLLVEGAYTPRILNVLELRK